MSFAEEIKSNKYVHDVFARHENPDKIAGAMLIRGDLRPFYSFYREVQNLAGKCGEEELEGMYNFAVRRAHFAKDIRQFLREADILPDLRWEQSLHPDGCKRHEKFFNKVWSIRDPFWLDNMPLDNTDCGCYLSSTDDPATNRGKVQLTSGQPWVDMIRNKVSHETFDDNQDAGIVLDESELIQSAARIMLKQCDKSTMSQNEAQRLVAQALQTHK